MNSMSKFAATFAAVATLALPISAIATGAQAETIHIPVADLNLNTPTGAAQFEARVQAAANRMCASYGWQAGHTACIQAVREEARDNLAAQLRQATQRSGATYASARR